MESCHKLTLEDSRSREPLARGGGHGREQPTDDAVTEVFASLGGALHDPQRWGRSSAAIGTLGERLYEFWQRFRGCFKTSTRDTSGRAYPYLRGQLTMEGERNFANMARNMTGDDGQALQHFMSNSPWSGPGVFRQIQAEITATPCGAQKCCRVTAFSRRDLSGCTPPRWSKARALLCAQGRELYGAGSDGGSRYGACSRRKPAINRKWRRLLVTRVWSPSRAIAAISASGIPRPLVRP